MAVLRRGRCGGDRESGAAAVEFALISVPLLIIVFGLIQYGLYFWSAQTGSNTVHTAARQLSVGNCQSSSSLQTLVDDKLGAAAVSAAVIDRDYFNVDGTAVTTSTAPQDVEVGGTVTLTITFDTANLNFPFVPFLDDPKVTREVVARVEDTTEQGCPS